MRFGVPRDEINRGVHRGPELRRPWHRGGIWSPGVEGLVDLRGVNGPAVALEIPAVTEDPEGDLAVPLGIESPGGHGDPGIREPDGPLDPSGATEEPRGHRDVLLARGHGRGVPDLELRGELLALGHDVPWGDHAGMAPGEPVDPFIRDDHEVPIGGRGNDLNDFPFAAAQRDP